MNCANHPDRERMAFCQNCGKPLCVECSRVVGQAVFCEPCLAARLAGTGPLPGGAGAGASRGGNVPPSGFSGVIPPPSVPGEPNPGLAALLGFIPGVGAFYNGQYAKGVVHLIIFAVLISLADQNGIFGLFIAGWVFYQVIEAHHTARARRDGTPLPNPFGLNDLSERLGFGRSWPGAGNGYSAPPPVGAEGAYVPRATNAYAAGAAQAHYGGVAGASSWGSPEETYAATGQAPFPAAPAYAGAAGQAYPGGQPYTAVPPGNPYAEPFSPDMMTPPATDGRLPTGALVLIGLGAFFLLLNTGHFGSFALQWFVPLALVGIGVWIFMRRMTNTGLSFMDDGSAAYRLRLYSALRSALWPILVGVLLFLDMTHILTWGHSWPLLIVLAGVMALLRRAAYAGVPLPPFPSTPVAPMGGPVAPAPPSAGSAIVPSKTPKSDGTLGDRS